MEVSFELVFRAMPSGNGFLDMAATMERLEEYRMHNTQFCKRLYDYLCIMFTAQVRTIHSECLVPDRVLGFSPQSTLLLGQSNGLSKSIGRRNLEIKGHKELESYLDRYCGLILYMKEMDEVAYGKLCAVRVSLAPHLASVANSSLGPKAYFSASSQLHNTQMTSLLSNYNGSIKKAQEDDPDNNSP